MYILEPVQHKTIWGGEKLKRYVSNPEDKIGHLYLVSGYNGMTNKIINGEYAQKTLRQIFPLKKDEWKMTQYEEFPLTIALVDAAQSLSIQVHPDDIMAEMLEKKRIGKTESWYFFDAPFTGWIYNGCSCKTVNELKNAVEYGKMEQITGRLPIEENTYVCIHAGTLHAMTAGSLVYEIEYGSNFTYRFYDYDRVDKEGNIRELHVDKALKSIKLGLNSKANQVTDQEWISEENYEIKIINSIDSYQNNSSVVEIISLINGEGFCDNQNVKAGMSILLLPGEKIEDFVIRKAVIARLRH